MTGRLPRAGIEVSVTTTQSASPAPDRRRPLSPKHRAAVIIQAIRSGEAIVKRLISVAIPGVIVVVLIWHGPWLTPPIISPPAVHIVNTPALTYTGEVGTLTAEALFGFGPVTLGLPLHADYPGGQIRLGSNVCGNAVNEAGPDDPIGSGSLGRGDLVCWSIPAPVTCSRARSPARSVASSRSSTRTAPAGSSTTTGSRCSVWLSSRPA